MGRSTCVICVASQFFEELKATSFILTKLYKARNAAFQFTYAFTDPKASLIYLKWLVNYCH